MAEAAEELSITILPDEEANLQDATGQVQVAKKEEAVAKVEVKDPALQDLMQQYKDLETRAAEQEKRRIKAEEEAARHRQEAETANKRATTSQLDTISTALSGAQEDAERAKRDIRVARASGDVDAEADAIDRLTTAKATMLRLDEAKSDMEARSKAPPPKPAPSNDPVEAFCQGRTAPTANWVRAHPEYVTSDRGLRKLTAADAVAQAEDLIPDTPEYFARVEEYLGLRKQPEVQKAPTEAAQVTVQPPKRSPAPPVAPGSNGGGNGGGSGNGMSVTLTSREAAAAQDGTHVWNYSDPNGKFKKGEPIGVQEFARRKLAMMRSGVYDRTYESQ